MNVHSTGGGAKHKVGKKWHGPSRLLSTSTGILYWSLTHQIHIYIWLSRNSNWLWGWFNQSRVGVQSFSGTTGAWKSDVMEYLQQHGIIHNTFSLSDPRFKLLSKFETKYQINQILSFHYCAHRIYLCMFYAWDMWQYDGMWWVCIS